MGSQGPGMTSSPWEDRATWLPARVVEAGPWGVTRTLIGHRKRIAGGCRYLITPLFLLTVGQPCWTVSLKAQETHLSPCWRDHLHTHSQMKVGSLMSQPPSVFDVTMMMMVEANPPKSCTNTSATWL